MTKSFLLRVQEINIETPMGLNEATPKILLPIIFFGIGIF